MADLFTPDLSESDEEIRLECIRLAMAFAEGDPVANAERIFKYIKEGALAESARDLAE